MLVPQLLVNLIETGTWSSLTGASLHSAIPNLPCDVNLNLITSMDTLSRCGESISYDAEQFGVLGMVDGSKGETSINLPLLDLQRCYFIGFGRRDGDDTWLALCYSDSPDSDPSVVTNRWSSAANCSGILCEWYTINNTFTDFVTRLGIDRNDTR